MNFNLEKLTRKEQVSILKKRMAEVKCGNLEIGIDCDCDLIIEDGDRNEKVFLSEGTNYEGIIDELKGLSQYILDYAKILEIKIADEDERNKK